MSLLHSGNLVSFSDHWLRPEPSSGEPAVPHPWGPLPGAFRAQGQQGCRCQMLSGSSQHLGRQGRGGGSLSQWVLVLSARLPQGRALQWPTQPLPNLHSRDNAGGTNTPLLSSILPPSAVPPSAEPNGNPRTENGGMQSRRLSRWCRTGRRLERPMEAAQHPGFPLPRVGSERACRDHVAGLFLGSQPQFPHL